MAVSSGLVTAGQKENKEPPTQTLEAVPEPPQAVAADVSRLVFGVTTARTSGLLSKQVRETAQALAGSMKKARVVRLRAFVAGSGDTRRVQEVVSEVFTKKRQPVPTMSVVQVGRLPVQGSQVVFEYVAEHKKIQNPHGVAFVSGQTVNATEPTLNVAPLAQQSLARVKQALARLGTKPPEPLLVTCYCSSLMDGPDVRKAMSTAFPDASLNLMQLRRSYTEGSVSCEAVARLSEPAPDTMRVTNSNGTPHFSDVAVVNDGRITFTSSQLAFRYQDSDIRLAFERLGRMLEDTGSSFNDVVATNIYPLTLAIADKIQTLGFEFFNRARPPASTLIELEGLPSLDASFAVDAVARVP